MSKKKEKSVSLRDLEGEIVRLEAADNEPDPEPSPGLKNFFGELLQQQSQQHAELLKALATSSQTSSQAVVAAVKEAMKPDPLPAPKAHSAVAPSGLYMDDAPSEFAEEVFLASDEETDTDFLGWEFPEPGQQVHQEVTEPIVHLPGTSQSNPQSDPAQPAAATAALEGLYSHDKDPNWDPPVDLLDWFESKNSKEMSPASVKEISENFIPQPKYQHLFTAPPLPQAISDRLVSAPKYLTKVPKLVNDKLLASQRDIMVALKPMIEVLSFYFSTEFLTLREFVPEIAPIFDTVSISICINISFLCFHFLLVNSL